MSIYLFLLLHQPVTDVCCYKLKNKKAHWPLLLLMIKFKTRAKMLANKPKRWQTNQNAAKQTKFVCQNSALRQNLDKNQILDKQIDPFHIQITLLM